MSSPFAQKFFGKKPFTSVPKKKEQDYEAKGKKAKELEKKYSADRGDAPDYEARLMVQKEMAKGKSPLNGAYESGAGGIVYLSTAPYFRDLQNKIMQGTQQAMANEAARDREEKKRDDAAAVAAGNMTQKQYDLLYPEDKNETD